MTNAQKVASGIRRLASEHGVPNNFTAGEIAHLVGLPPFKVGLILTRENILVNDALAERGFRLRRYGKDDDGISWAMVD